MLVNAEGKVFVGQRNDSPLEAWQMPQGGIDPGEDAEAAALRELGEETGVMPDKVELIAEAPGEFVYDLPPELLGKVWKGKWRGQTQRWFLYRFLGTDADVDIATEHEEFRAWRWSDPADLPRLIVPFKEDALRTGTRRLRATSRRNRPALSSSQYAALPLRNGCASLIPSPSRPVAAGERARSAIGDDPRDDPRDARCGAGVRE